MTLIEASDLTTPILQSELFEKSPELQKKVEEINALMKKLGEDAFKAPGHLPLDQFRVAHKDVEKGFRDFIKLYEELSKKSCVG